MKKMIVKNYVVQETEEDKKKHRHSANTAPL